MCVRRSVGSFSPSLHLLVQHVPEHRPTSETACLKINVKWTDSWYAVRKECGSCRQCSLSQFGLWVGLRMNRCFTEAHPAACFTGGGGTLHPSVSCCVGDNIKMVRVKTAFRLPGKGKDLQALKNKLSVARSTLEAVTPAKLMTGGEQQGRISPVWDRERPGSVVLRAACASRCTAAEPGSVVRAWQVCPVKFKDLVGRLAVEFSHTVYLNCIQT